MHREVIMSVTLVNLTPHTVTVVGLTIPPSGTVARCCEVSESRGTIEAGGTIVPLVAKRFGEVENLPEPAANTIYIVSALAAQAAWAAGRRDVVCPGDPVRDAEGRIIGAASLCVAP
jgi:hypothetical protein